MVKHSLDGRKIVVWLSLFIVVFSALCIFAARQAAVAAEERFRQEHPDAIEPAPPAR
ncbi:MAG: hypothetical protein M9921_02010 [Fimbriimonadaceae bacterium]|nr:hypothetical protein [Fimbriimonadaceae bacterium]